MPEACSVSWKKVSIVGGQVGGLVEGREESFLGSMAGHVEFNNCMGPVGLA